MGRNIEKRFQLKLQHQLDFINNSCNFFDNGNKEEAIRIGTSLRILFHDTSKSKSLLSHLTAKNTHIISTCKIDPIAKGTIFFDGLASFSAAGPSPKLGRSSNFHELPANEWWNQIVLVADREIYIRRSDIALVAANKDGGAHVDETLTPEYEKLVIGIWKKIEIKSSEDKEQPLPNHHLIYLRQMGYEVLNSPQLQSLMEL